MNKRLSVAAWLVLLGTGLNLMIVACSVSALAAPSMDSISAALKKQEEACGASLDISYVWEGVKRPEAGSPRSEMRYVRTPQRLFLEEKQGRYASSGTWSVYETTTCVFDRVTTEFREICKSPSGDVIGARMGKTISNRFTSDPIPDVLFKRIPITPFFEAVRTGKVAREQEVVDGAKCWRIDIPGQAVEWSESWSVWLDPKLGFCPRQIVTKFSSEGRVKNAFTEVFSHYQQFGRDVWIPMLQVLSNGTQIVVKSVAVGKKIASDDLSVTFPPGTQVLQVPSVRGCF